VQATLPKSEMKNSEKDQFFVCCLVEEALVFDYAGVALELEKLFESLL